MNGTTMVDAFAWRVFDCDELLAQALANDVQGRLEQAITRKNMASLVVSGGATPYAFFAALKHKALPWEKLAVTLTDERCVPIDNNDSNEKMLHERFLNPRSNFLSLAPKVDESSAQAVVRLQLLLRQRMPFDVLVLGMGVDSHVASLFPGNPIILADHDAILTVVEDAPKAPAQRISMTPKTLLNTQHLIIHITGQAKRNMIEEALASGDVSRYPIAAFLLQQRTPLTIYWAP